LLGQEFGYVEADAAGTDDGDAPADWFAVQDDIDVAQ
jgi:hypothetical protein